MDRIVGVLTLRAPVYRQIAEDGSATRTAAIIIAIVSIISGVVGAWVISYLGSQLPAGTVGADSSNWIVWAVITIVLSFVAWGLASWVMGLVANLLGGKTNTGEMLRVFGFTSIFNLLGVIPCLGIIAVFLGIVAAFLGIREAAGVSTGKALAIGIVGALAIIIVSVILSVILGFILGPTGLIG